MSQEINFTLPLPQSKNTKHGFSKGRVYLNQNVVDYYDEVYKIIRWDLRINKHFTRDAKIVIWCNWFVKRQNSDVHNFHSVLADALEKAFEINDKFFLLRDFDKTVDTENPRVDITMNYL